MVIGCSGSGKSTFSKKLGAIIGLEVLHLDQHYWKPNWIESTPEEWREKVKDLSEKDSWIMDGNYSGTWDIRIPRADTIIFLNRSTWQCLKRITSRILKYRGTERPDMPEGCKERFDAEFYHYVATYNIRNRRKILKRLNSLKDQKEVIILKSDEESELFLNELRI